MYGELASGTCKPCHERCANCIGPTENSCTKCNNGYYLNKDLNKPNVCSVNCSGNLTCG